MHAFANLDDPSQSRFSTDGVGLPFSELIALHNQSAQLAFLSACETTATSHTLADEAIHLSTAIHLAGFPEVIGTQRRVPDLIAEYTAKIFYAQLLHGSPAPSRLEPARRAGLAPYRPHPAAAVPRPAVGLVRLFTTSVRRDLWKNASACRLNQRALAPRENPSPLITIPSSAGLCHCARCAFRWCAQCTIPLGCFPKTRSQMSTRKRATRAGALSLAIASAFALAASSAASTVTSAGIQGSGKSVQAHPMTWGSREVADLPTPLPTSQCKAQLGINCYSPLQYRSAYDLNPLYQAGITGRGKTIVIVDSYGSPTIQADLDVFDKQWGLPDTKVDVRQFGTIPAFDPTGLRPWSGGPRRRRWTSSTRTRSRPARRSCWPRPRSPRPRASRACRR